MRTQIALWAGLAVSIVDGGCTGQVLGGMGERPAMAGAPAAAGAGSENRPGAPGPADPQPGGGARDASPGEPLPASRPRAPLRRLSRAQYNNTVRDLLGDATHPADGFVVEEAPGSFAGSVASTQASPTVVEQYRAAAERLAASAVRNLATLVPCAPAPGKEEDCARTFIEEFGLRALRRPVTKEEGDGLLALQRAVQAEGDFALGIQAVLAALLQSPGFLYRVESAPPGAAPGSVIPLGPYDIASRLSYFLVDSMPDRELFAAAKAGKLGTIAELEAQARRLLASPRAREASTAFFAQWLSLASLDVASKDPRLFPEFNEGLRRAMREETTRFANWALFDGDGRLDTLLASKRSVINAGLGKLYGVPAGADYALTDLPAGERSGLLTHASLLTLTAHSDSTSPTRRGKFVLDQVLCQSPPPPPANVDFKLPAPTPGQSARERFGLHTQNPACGACHLLMDPIGFGFDNYDAIGRFQATLGGKPVDASGQVMGSADLDGPFVGVVELGRKLADSAQVRRCLVQQWFRFSQGRSDEAGDAASTAAALDAFAASGSNVRELMVAMVKTDAFRLRVVEGAP